MYVPQHFGHVGISSQIGLPTRVFFAQALQAQRKWRAISALNHTGMVCDTSWIEKFHYFWDMTPPRKNTEAWPYLALTAGILCIAWSAIFVRWTDMPGPASAFYRMLIPAILLVPSWLVGPRRPSVDRKTLLVIAVGGLFFALDLAFFNTSILQTSAANATLLGNNTPVFVGLLSWLIFRQRPSTAFWIGLLLALAGCMVIVWGDLARHFRLGWGDAMALAASACFAVYMLATEQVRKTSSTLVFLRLAMISSAAFLFLINVALGFSLRVPAGRSWAALAGLGLVSQLGGYLALTYALGHLPATAASISLLTQAPLTAILAALVLAEPLAGSQIVGGALVLMGVGLANWRMRPTGEVPANLLEVSGHE
jgi:drug/metabolite transporter (DMT)-like permease